MLHKIDDQGNTAHVCPHCGTLNQHHISHEKMEWIPCGTMIALPPCTNEQCAKVNTRTSVRVTFPPVEIPPRERWQDLLRDPQDLLIVVAHDEQQLGENGKPVVDESGAPVIVRIVDNVFPHPAIAKHQELARQITAIGKTVPALPESAPKTKEQILEEIKTMLASMGLKIVEMSES